MRKNLFKLVLTVIAFAFAFFILFLIYSTITFYKPKDKEVLLSLHSSDTLDVNVNYSVLSWNIGYAGLGDNMDFFYDGGKKVRDSKERTLQNFDSIQSFLKKADANFLMLQEVDIFSRRSYGTNQLVLLSQSLKKYTYFAHNYKVSFVPIPLKSPMGVVNSGIVTLSDFIPQRVVRYQLPGLLPWPKRIFSLRRCILVCRYPVKGGNELVLINIHNSAYEGSTLNNEELNFIKQFAITEYQKGNFVLAGGDWNQTPPGLSLDKFGESYEIENFSVRPIPNKLMPTNWIWGYDSSKPTNRFLDKPLSDNTRKVILDFFLISPNVELVEEKTIDLHFKSSDHNPIILKFKLKPNQN
ncbi:endonuclease/exonuclease/phosphatase family protein [Tenuifilum thalassicum]|uniref:Endonuclease/exonuclease/phosphatase family protein n=1 Tax=Tenuifilum thalassicum TaxID=2590900 RepID=A0A7D3XKX6_9BACT|nr:endonuclease/exonuclease/phosphatase family protein [Tenuifilum thalassicum]QKG78956.1 endonuclease/exonuclease/phosphatase family protein [Tenuifilum thalassicum]